MGPSFCEFHSCRCLYCLALPEAFTQPGTHLLAKPRTHSLSLIPRNLFRVIDERVAAVDRESLETRSLFLNDFRFRLWAAGEVWEDSERTGWCITHNSLDSIDVDYVPQTITVILVRKIQQGLYLFPSSKNRQSYKCVWQDTRKGRQKYAWMPMTIARQTKHSCGGVEAWENMYSFRLSVLVCPKCTMLLPTIASCFAPPESEEQRTSLSYFVEFIFTVHDVIDYLFDSCTSQKLFSITDFIFPSQKSF